MNASPFRIEAGPAKRERARLSTTSPSTTSNPLLNDRNFTADYGRLEPVSPLIRRIVAHNPGPFTFFGTGTYVVGHGKVAVIDPGPDLPEHVAALLAGLAGETVSHILITHTHLDHSPAAAALQAATGAPTHGFGPHGRMATPGNPAPTSPSPPIIGWATGMASRGRAGGWRRCIPPAMPPTISASLFRRSGPSSPATM